MLEKVMRYCPEYKLTEQDKDNIVLASIGHDIGKLLIPDHILNKPDKLTHDEFMIMKNHTWKGKRIFAHLREEMDEDNPYRNWVELSEEIAFHHHERFDGGGYPEGLKGNEISIGSQVVGMVDAYDALISDRIYSPAHDREEAFEMIVEGECGVFNPRLIEIFRMVRMELEEVLDENNKDHMAPRDEERKS